MTKIERDLFWQLHLETQQKSGQTIKDYCFTHQLKAHSFYHWKKKNNCGQALANFTRLKVQRPASAAVLSFGLTKLELPLGTDLDTLAQLMLKLNGKS